MLSKAEVATILAALRYYQQNGQADPANRSDEIHNIATDNDADMTSLDDAGIDELCQKINHGVWYDLMDGKTHIISISTKQAGEDGYHIGTVIPPRAGAEHNLKNLWNEWMNEVDEPEADSEFIDWLCDKKGWQDVIGDSVVIQI